MCRLYGFRSSVLSRVHASLIAAENALAQQSVLHPDGWGIVYYNDRYPHLIRSEKQALDDGLLREVSGVVSTRTLLAHIRQATTGKISVLNCHPFQFGSWSFAHNGQIAEYANDPEVRQRFREFVDPRFRTQILGNTDSEVLFYIFMSRLARRAEDINSDGVRREWVLDSLRETTHLVLDNAPEPDPTEPSRLNFMVTNGSLLVGTCYRRSLYFSTYKTKCPERDTCHAYEESKCESEVSEGIVKHLVVSSEPVADNPNVWVELEDGEYVSVDHGMHFQRGRILGGPKVKEMLKVVAG